ncbi:hypothetical protein QYF36_018377 [Acer negundo]|nr:hypothetical protein QYF36_018377 [Acer negundo]
MAFLGPSFAEVVRGPKEDSELNRNLKKVVMQWEDCLNDDKWLNLCAIWILKVFSDVASVEVDFCGMIVSPPWELGHRRQLLKRDCLGLIPRAFHYSVGVMSSSSG